MDKGEKLKDATITVRISAETKFRLRKAMFLRPPYAIPMSTIVERGIELACAELEALANTPEKEK